jgi:hypothetical protein
MALNLVVAAVTLWNTAYLDRALKAVEERGIPLPVSRCSQIPDCAIFIFNSFPAFQCRVVVLKSRIVAVKSRTNFRSNFVRGFNAVRPQKAVIGAFLTLNFGPELRGRTASQSGI